MLCDDSMSVRPCPGDVVKSITFPGDRLNAAACLRAGEKTFTRPRAGGKCRDGFSMIEMTAVLALMAILAGIVTLNVRHHLLAGKQNAARTELATINDAVEGFFSVNGRYPTSDEGLAILTQKSDRSPEPLLKHLPVDPWGHPYQYNQPGRNGEPFEVVCFGADGREGGDGANADIYSWDLKAKPAQASAVH